MASGTISCPNVWAIRGQLGQGDDLNNMIGLEYSGIYSIGENVSNAPYSWMMLINIAMSSNSTRQICVRNTNSLSTIYTRAYMGTPRAWTSWMQFDGTPAS